MVKRLFLTIALVALVVPACGGDDGGVDVTLSDYVVAPATSSASAGELTFNLSNEASQTHEFVIFRTDLASDAMPVGAEGDVDEEGEGVEAIDEIEDIAAGADATLTVTLDAGSYVFLCNLPGHYRQGMHIGFTVS